MPMKGFTLVELLIVVAILSAVAMVSIGLMSEDRVQIHIDDTRNRLAVLRRAVLGVESPAYGGEMRLSGFVADNGRLPTDIHELLDRELLDADGDVVRTHAASAGVVPDHSVSIDSQCIQTASGAPLGEAARLLKGHRGNYLAGAAHNGAFRDGWGNVGQGDDAINFGWTVANDTNANSITFGSLGADNASGKSNGLDAEDDQAMSIADAEWRVPLDGWQITVSNASSDAAPISISGLSAKLLVFENTHSSGRWRQFKTNGTACPGSLASGESCTLRYVADVDGKIECDSPANLIEARVPQGRHVLVVSASVTVTDPIPGTAQRHIVRQVDFYPGTLPPNLTLEVRP